MTEPEDRRPSDAPADTVPRDARWRVAAIVVPAGVLVDQITKQVAQAELAPRGVVPVVDGVFMLRYSLNRGAFFSLGEDMPESLRRGFFVVATLAAIALIVHLYGRARDGRLRWALLFLLTGAIGNLVDRALYGEVIDFLHLHWQDAFHWATFNVADVFIAAGLLLLALDVLRGDRGARARASDGAATAPAEARPLPLPSAKNPPGPDPSAEPTPDPTAEPEPEESR